jgi:hypothetical protein
VAQHGVVWQRTARQRIARRGKVTKRRYSIWVREVGSDHDVELMELDGDPAPIVKGLRAKTLTIKKSIFERGRRKSTMPKYSWVRVVKNDYPER